MDAVTQRFHKYSRVDEATGCWTWTGYALKNGYPVISVGDGVQMLAHRWAYDRFVAPIPEGHQVHHRCENKACLNPLHLQAVTPWEHTILLTPNSPSFGFARQTHCLRGHPLSGDNLYRYGRARQCKRCRAERARKYKQR